MEVRESGNSLVRMSALGVDGGVIASSLSLRETGSSILGLQDQSNQYTTKTLHFNRLFSMMLAIGMRTRRSIK